MKKTITLNFACFVFVLLVGSSIAHADDAIKLANVRYGEHERQVFDVWLADTIERQLIETNPSIERIVGNHGNGIESDDAGNRLNLLRISSDQRTD